MEIERLHKMLTEAGIEHEWLDRSPPEWEKLSKRSLKEFGVKTWGYQIIVYKSNGDRLVSAIEGFGTYGYGLNGERGDSIEIMGLLTPEEEECDSVAGWLTADEVFRRIVEALG